MNDKSNSFQLEASLFRSTEAISRLCLVLAVATLFLVSQGTEGVASEKRRWVDTHWFRGNSYLKIGWKWARKDRSPARWRKLGSQHDCLAARRFQSVRFGESCHSCDYTAICASGE